MKKNCTNDLIDLADKLKSIGHSDRLLVLKLLYKERKTVKAIYDNLGLEQSVVSRHLSILRNVGIVAREQDGKKTYYRLRTEKKNVSMLSKCLRDFFAN